MSTLRVQVTFDRITGIPADAVTNTLHFETAATVPTPTDLSSLAVLITDFYRHAPVTSGGSLSIAQGLLSQVLAGTATTRIYDLAEPTPRTPIYEDIQTPFTPVAGALGPAEVAMVLSFQGALQSGIAQATRRNRIYVGPCRLLDGGAGPVAGDSRPSVTARSILAGAGRFLLANAPWPPTSGNPAWVTRSEKLGSVAPVVNGWVDDAWDTQRRRGSAPTTRLEFNSVTPI